MDGGFARIIVILNGVKNPFSPLGITDCHVAALLAMTGCVYVTLNEVKSLFQILRACGTQNDILLLCHSERNASGVKNL